MTSLNAPDVKALIFDVFGTLVDWRTCIAREVAQWLAPEGIELDGLRFADDWRAQYPPAMEKVRAGLIPFCKLDQLHRHNLDIVLRAHGLEAVAESTRRELNLAWHRLDAWPDVAAGLAALRQRYLLAPCSNGNISLMVDLARRNGWHWDAILGAEVARDYKPKPAVYLAACAAFDLEPHEVMMVAAHSSDLQAAAECGLATCFVARPDEYGPGAGESEPTCPVDVRVGSLLELALERQPQAQNG